MLEMTQPALEKIENCYTVEGVPRSGNQFEYLACRLKKGTPVSYKHRHGFGEKFETGTGVFVYSWLYDGVTAVIETPERINLSLACGDEIYVLEDASELCLPSMHGDGI